VFVCTTTRFRPPFPEFLILHHHIGRGLVTIVLLSLGSACCYGIAAVLQHRAAVDQPRESSMRAGLLVRLARRPMWLVGNALDGAGYLLQFLALRRGSLPLVEPLLVLSLVFALPVSAWLDHRRIGTNELISTGIIAAGLALFLGVAQPGLGHPHAPGSAWVILTIAIAASCLVLVLGAHRGSSRRAAVMLAAGSGIAFGYVAALTERTGHLLGAGIVHTLATWVPYALLAGGAVALLMTQSAFNAGALRLSLPTLTVAQPLVAIAIGLAMFGEKIDSHGIAPEVEVVGLILVTVGVFALASSSVAATHSED
jgi:drug/metabolite transporter (DMT)-like permease